MPTWSEDDSSRNVRDWRGDSWHEFPASHACGQRSDPGLYQQRHLPAPGDVANLVLTLFNFLEKALEGGTMHLEQPQAIRTFFF